MAIGPKSEKKHWDRFWEGAHSVEDVYSNEGRVAERIAGAVPLAEKLVLEVGAGSGRDGVLLAEKGACVVSLDYSLSSLRLIKGRSSGSGTLAVCCGDAFALPFADGTFDVVFHQGLLEHFRNPDDLIAENARVLKPGGVILVDVPQRYHYYTAIKHLAIAMRVWFAGWEREYSVGELERMLRAHSFSIVASYGEWFNPPMWYRMLRRGLVSAGVKLPMYPRAFAALGKAFAGPREALMKRRFALYTTVIIGTIARKE
ncbi:MAG: class I SAM-dependent methyltransferase [Candidatus Krumholzibacteria bacterium]|nr:class I SAM-dependent methyltransferase [Candidatus Krumholzibacteria bacterium]